MDTDARKTVLRMIPYGLFVLTADGGSDVGAGTINWVSQMSFEPPLLALGVKKDSKTFAQVKAGGKLGLSFLGSGQGDLAFAFFGDAPIEGDAFVVKGSRIPFSRTAGGAIVLDQAHGWAELRLVDTVETGDHAVVVVEVTDVGQQVDEPQMLTLKELNLNYGG
ncbi:MAG: flavin reductase family protein [Dehalococcoidia bacterium]